MPRRPVDTSIGARIQTRRKLRGWSIRYAADRAGMSHTTWSRIERGVVSADNRFVLADIAGALECSVVDLAGLPAAPDTRDEALMAVAVDALHIALVDADPTEDPTCAPPLLPELEKEADLVRHLRIRCDYLPTAQRLPTLIRNAHAATHGPERRPALRLLAGAAYDAAALTQATGYRRDGWLAAHRCQQAAEALDEPVMLAYASFTVATAAAAVGAYTRAATRASRAVDELSRHLDAPEALTVLGMLHLTCALAARGEKRDAESREWVDEAAALAARTGESDVLDLGFGPTNAAIWQVSIEADGGEPGRAVEVGSRVDPALLPYPSRQATFHVDTARALTRMKRDRDALRHLLVAERLSPMQVRMHPLVRETVRGMLDRSSAGQLRGLCERMRLMHL